MVGNGYKWLEMAGSVWKWLEWLERAGYGGKWLEIAQNYLKWLNISGNGLISLLLFFFWRFVYLRFHDLSALVLISEQVKMFSGKL